MTAFYSHFEAHTVKISRLCSYFLYYFSNKRSIETHDTAKVYTQNILYCFCSVLNEAKIYFLYFQPHDTCNVRKLIGKSHKNIRKSNAFECHEERKEACHEDDKQASQMFLLSQLFSQFFLLFLVENVEMCLREKKASLPVVEEEDLTFVHFPSSLSSSPFASLMKFNENM